MDLRVFGENCEVYVSKTGITFQNFYQNYQETKTIESATYLYHCVIISFILFVSRRVYVRTYRKFPGRSVTCLTQKQLTLLAAKHACTV